MSVSPQPTRPGQFGRSFPLDEARWPSSWTCSAARRGGRIGWTDTQLLPEETHEIWSL
jgi:hypothetical protein